MKYAGYVIVTEPDYKTALEQQEPPEDLYCMVYDEADTSQNCCLMDFPMTQAIEYEESTVDSIEEGIKNAIDNNLSFLELGKKERLFQRQSTLFHRAIDLLKTLDGDDIRRTLSNTLGMTDAEIDDALSEPTAEQTEGINML